MKHRTIEKEKKVDCLCLTLGQVQNLWRTAYKLTKVFAHPDYKGPMRASATIKAKLEKFKISMPIICALCNPGIKQRHWDMMSKKVRVGGGGMGVG